MFIINSLQKKSNFDVGQKSLLKASIPLLTFNDNELFVSVSPVVKGYTYVVDKGMPLLE